MTRTAFLLLVCLSVLPVLGQRTSSSTPPADWAQKGACPFECCRYGKWTARAGFIVYAQPDKSSMGIGQIRQGEAFQASTGETHTKAGRFRFTKAQGSLKAGDQISVYDYIGEGNYRAWLNGAMGEIELAAGPTGSGVMDRRPQQEWWVHVTTSEGKTGWILVESPRTLGGADACE